MNKGFLFKLFYLFIAFTVVNFAQAPVIVIEPQNRGVIEGQTASFFVQATGDSLSYQWYKNDTLITGANDSIYTTPATVLSDNLSKYKCVVTNSYGSDTSNAATLFVTASGSRVTEGLILLYNFNEAGGDTVLDNSGYGTPLGMKIFNTSAVSWTPKGLATNDKAFIRSNNATKVIDASTATNEVTVEAWVVPALSSQAPLSRIVTLGQGYNTQNYAIMQSGDSYVVRMRSTEPLPSDIGEGIATAPGTVTTQLTHLLFTRRSDGISYFYINGNIAFVDTGGGDFSNWFSANRFQIANDFGDGPWLGTYYLVSVYERSLDQPEVLANYNYGVDNDKKPAIIFQPQDLGLIVGQPATFTVKYVGDPSTIVWRKNGVDIVGANSDSYTIPAVSISDNFDEYSCVITNAFGSDTSRSAKLNVTALDSRVSNGQLALYTFQENGGTVINDVSGYDPFNLDILTPGAVTWKPYGLFVNSPANIRSAVPATKIIDSVKSKGEFTFETWVKPENLTQTPATIATLSSLGGPSFVNFVMNQDVNRLQTWFRTTTAPSSGLFLQTPPSTLGDSLLHIVYTFNNKEISKIYINGNLVTDSYMFGKLSNWNSGFYLRLADQFAVLSSFKGFYNLVSFYKRALSPSEINHNFTLGPINVDVKNPSNLTAQVTQIGKVNLAWDDSSNNEDGFILERKYGSFDFTVIDSLLPNTTTYVDSTVLDTTNYTYRVKAYNLLKQSGYSNTASVTTPLSTLAAPSSFTAALSQTFLNHVELSWQDNSPNEDGFIIERRVEGTKGAFTPIDSVGANVTAYVDSLVADTTTYTYRVQAYNQFLLSAYSDTASVTTLLSTLAAPTFLSAQLFGLDSQYVQLNWVDNSSNELGFIIERKDGNISSPNPFAVIDSVGMNMTVYVDTTVIFDSIYTYRVYAYNQFLVSAYSNLTDIRVPVELISFTAQVINGQVTLKWETATETNNSGFTVQRSKDNIKFTDLAFIKGKGTTTTQSSYHYIDKSILTGKYYYRLKQVDYSGAFTFSNTLEVDLGLPKEFSLYQNFPNPFNPSTTIRFALPVNSIVNLKLYNALGQEVVTILNTELEAGIHQTVFDASQLSSGVYFYMLKVQGENGSNFTSTKRMVLIK